MVNGDHLAITAIVEDHPLFRDAIAAVVDSMPNLELGPVLSDAAAALEAFAETPPDIVLVDFSLDSGSSALDLISTIGERWPDTRCLVVSGHLQAEYADASLAAGAFGYVLKGRPDDFEKAIGAVLAGERYVSPAVHADSQDAGHSQ